MNASKEKKPVGGGRREAGMNRNFWLCSIMRKWLHMDLHQIMGKTRWHSGKELACQFRRRKKRGFNLWVGKIRWRRAWQSTPVFLAGKLHGQRRLVVQSMRSQRVGHNWRDLASKPNLKYMFSEIYEIHFVGYTDFEKRGMKNIWNRGMKGFCFWWWR